MKNNDQFQIYDRRQWQDLPPQNKEAWNNFYMTNVGTEITDTMSYRHAQNHKKMLVVEKAVKGNNTLQNDPLLEVIDGREWQNVPAEEQSAWTKLAQELKENLNNTQDYLNIQRLQRARQFIESFEDLNISKQQEDALNLIASNKANKALQQRSSEEIDANKEMAKNMAAIDNNSQQAMLEKRQRVLEALEAKTLELAAKKKEIAEKRAALEKKKKEDDDAAELKQKQREIKKLEAQKIEVLFNQNSQSIKTQDIHNPYNQNQEESKELSKTYKKHVVSNAYKYQPLAEKLEQEKNDELLALELQQKYDSAQQKQTAGQMPDCNFFRDKNHQNTNKDIPRLLESGNIMIKKYTQPPANPDIPDLASLRHVHSQKAQNKDSEKLTLSEQEIEDAKLAEVLHYSQQKAQEESKKDLNKLSVDVNASISNISTLDYWPKLPQHKKDWWIKEFDSVLPFKAKNIQNAMVFERYLKAYNNVLTKKLEASQQTIDKTQLTKVTSDYDYALKSQAVDNAYDLNQNIQSKTLHVNFKPLGATQKASSQCDVYQPSQAQQQQFVNPWGGQNPDESLQNSYLNQSLQSKHLHSSVSTLDQWQKLSPSEKDFWMGKFGRILNIKIKEIPDRETWQVYNKAHNALRNMFIGVKMDHEGQKAIDKAYDQALNGVKAGQYTIDKTQHNLVATTQKASSQCDVYQHSQAQQQQFANAWGVQNPNESLQNSYLNQSLQLQYSSAQTHQQNIPQTPQPIFNLEQHLKDTQGKVLYIYNETAEKYYAYADLALMMPATPKWLTGPQQNVPGQPIFDPIPNNQPMFNHTSPWVSALHQNPPGQPIFDPIPNNQPMFNHTSPWVSALHQNPPGQPIFDPIPNNQPMFDPTPPWLTGPQQNPPGQPIFDPIPNNQPMFDPTPTWVSALHQNPPGQPIFDPIAPIDPQDNIKTIGNLEDFINNNDVLN